MITTKTTETETAQVGNALLAAITSGDYTTARQLLADGLLSRMLTPDGLLVDHDGDAAIAHFVGWLGPDGPSQVLVAQASTIRGRAVLRYRLRLLRPRGSRLIEQHLMLDVDGSLVTGIDLLCSGFFPESAPDTGEVHSFDAGTLGCGDGLADAFRSRVRRIPVGDVLAVRTADPAAKEDLPPLARMMGHIVRSIEPADEGQLLISIQRGR